jgi:hypothetical protein
MVSFRLLSGFLIFHLYSLFQLWAQLRASDSLLASQPHPCSHSLDVGQGGLVVNGTGPEFAADLVMEDAGTNPWKVRLSVIATETLQPFSWLPLSVSNAFHAILPGIPFPTVQMAPPINTLRVCGPPTLNTHDVVDMTVMEGTRLQPVASRQDIVRPLVWDGTLPSPSVEGVEPFKEPGTSFHCKALSCFHLKPRLCKVIPRSTLRMPPLSDFSRRDRTTETLGIKYLNVSPAPVLSIPAGRTASCSAYSPSSRPHREASRRQLLYRLVIV